MSKAWQTVLVSTMALSWPGGPGAAQDAGPAAQPTPTPAAQTGAAAAPGPGAAEPAAAAAQFPQCRRGRARVRAAFVETEAEAVAAAATPSPRPSPTPGPPPGCGEVRHDGKREAELRDTLTVVVTEIGDLLREAECRQKVLGRDAPEPIVLFLDDRPLLDIAEYPPTDPGTCRLRFPLRRSEGSREVWTHLLGRPGLEPREVKVSVGLSEGYPLPSDARISLRVIPIGWFLGWSALFALLVIGFLVLARRSDLLRDPGPSPDGLARRPFSLARTQACWWFFLALAAYLLIGMITGDFSTSINATVLTLMGISGGTAVGSAFVDAAKARPLELRKQQTAARALRARLHEIEAKLTAAEEELAKDPASAAKAEAVATLTAERAERESQLHKLANESESFVLDILSDANGVNFHRFQMAAWTIVLGIVFVGHVYKELAMPEFSETLLLLMGISAGTYIGLKIPEPTSPDRPPPQEGSAPPPAEG